MTLFSLQSLNGSLCKVCRKKILPPIKVLNRGLVSSWPTFYSLLHHIHPAKNEKQSLDYSNYFQMNSKYSKIIKQKCHKRLHIQNTTAMKTRNVNNESWIPKIFIRWRLRVLGISEAWSLNQSPHWWAWKFKTYLKQFPSLIYTKVKEILTNFDSKTIEST